MTKNRRFILTFGIVELPGALAGAVSESALEELGRQWPIRHAAIHY